MNDNQTTGVARVQRVVARIRRALAGEHDGVARAALRRRVPSRDKHLYDVALDLLVAVGDVMLLPAAHGGTRYRLVSLGAQQPNVGLASDTETTTKNALEGSTS